MISKKSLREFVEIYKKKYGIELTEKEAEIKANALLRLYKAIFGDPLLDLLKKQNNDR